MLLLLLACQVSPILQPETYASESGSVTFEVRPSDRSGLEGGDCTLRKDGVVVWESRVEHAPWAAAVAEDGTVAAFSLSGDYWSTESRFHVLLLASDGNVLLDEEHPRVSAGYSHSSPVPAYARVFLQPELERFTLLVHERSGPAWWVYDARTGARVGQHPLIPDTLSSGKSTWLQEARSVPATALVLLHWTAIDGGASFQLLDADREDAWRAVWRMERVDLSREDVSSIFSLSAGRFDVRTGDQRVGFEVTRTPSEWKMAEIERSRFEESTTEIPPLRLTLLSEDGHAPVRPVRAKPSRWRFAGPVVLGDVSGKLQEIERRPDGSWFRDIEGLAQAVDGTVVVIDCEPTNSSYVPRRPGKAVLSFFAADGTPRGVSPVLPEGITLASLDFQSGRVLINGHSEAFLFDVDLGAFHRLDLGDALRGTREARCELSADGLELTCVRGDRLLRFAVPR